MLAMKTRFLIILFAISVGIGIFFYTQNILLNEQIQLTAKNNTNLQLSLNNYTSIFGKTVFDDNDGDYQSINTLETKAFIASAVTEFVPVDVIKVGKHYSVTVAVSRPSGVADYPPLTGYVLHTQIMKQNEDNRVAGSWYQDTIRVNETINSGLYWSPQSTGNYTLEVFTWAHLSQGPTKAEAVRINFEVVK